MNDTQQTSFAAHLRAGLIAGLLLAVCQVALETLLIAIDTRGYVLAPEAFSPSQRFDFAVKLLSALPLTSGWVHSGVLDRFLSPGFVARLAIAGGLLLPNLVVGGIFGIVAGAVRHQLGAPARIGGAIVIVAALGVLVHVVGFVAAIHLPRTWAVRTLVRNVGRLVIWDGAWIAALALVLATVLSITLARLRPVYGAGVALATVAFAFFGLAAPGDGAVPPREAALAPQNETQKPVDNVILISIDSLRADRLGAYGNPRATSPTLDRLAAEGARFSKAKSATSWTLPSHMSMMTGRYTVSHGVLEDADRLPDSIPTLAEQLQGAQIATGGVVSMFFLSSGYGFARGFDDYDDHTIPAKTEGEAIRAEPAPKVEELATNWLKQHAGQRFLLFLHFWDVHYDYVPPPPYDTMFDPDYKGKVDGVNFMKNPQVRKGMAARDLEHLLALYDGEVRWVDDHIGRILGVVDQLGLRDRTAVIVTADHGDEFFEHGYKGHRRTLYDEVVHVPLIMRVPGRAAGVVVEDPVSLVDLMPTILDLTGVATPAGVEGASLAPDLDKGAAAAEARPLYAELCGKRRSQCQVSQLWQSQTLIHHFEPLRLELYGGGDAAQKRDLVRQGQKPDATLVDRLLEHMSSAWAMYRHDDSSRGVVEIDQATQDKLRVLGYGD